MTETLWGIMKGQTLEAHYRDLISSASAVPEETRTPEEVIAHIKEKLSSL